MHKYVWVCFCLFAHVSVFVTLCVCVCVCVCVCMHVLLLHICLFVYVWACMCVRVHMCVHMYVCVCMCVCVCVCVFMHIFYSWKTCCVGFALSSQSQRKWVSWFVYMLTSSVPLATFHLCLGDKKNEILCTKKLDSSDKGKKWKVWILLLLLLLLLRSPAISLGFTIFGWDFCVCDCFFNPTMKVVTFRLRGWCVLGVFFVAGIHPSRTWTSGSFESVRWNACVHRLDLGLYSHPKDFLGGIEFGLMLTPREKSPVPENFPRGGSNPRRCGQWAQTLPTTYSSPRMIQITWKDHLDRH